MRVLSAENVRKIEQKAFESGISYLEMMENAGSEAARIITEKTDVKGKNIVVVAGGGNNGGDGYVIARILAQKGALVRVLYLDEPKTDSAKIMKERFSGEVIEFEASYLFDAHIIVDALFGIGLSKELKGKYLNAVNVINASAAYTVAVDIPSGLFADSMEFKTAVKADLTITFIAYKLCQLLYPAASFCGEIVLSYIGLPKYLYEQVETVGEIIPAPYFKPREKNTHKGTYGTLSLVCGSYGMAGASILASRAALKSGIGIARLCIPESIYCAVTGAVPEAVCCLYKETDNMKTVAQRVTKGASAVLVGCGLSVNDYAQKLVKEILLSYSGKLIIDADGINIVSLGIECIKSSKADIILTPHPGEMARLCKTSTKEIEKDRVGYAVKVAKELNCTVVLKGSITIVANRNGKVYFNLTGNAGMATGGSGDVLAGIISALACTGSDCFESAANGVYIHGAAGDKASSVLGMISALPSDTINYLPELFKRFEER